MALLLNYNMTRRKPRYYNPEHLIEEIKKWPNPMHDKKHGYDLYLTDDRARSNESRIDHIVEYGHDLKVRDLRLVPNGIKNYFDYRKDPIYKDTFNYYLRRGGKDRGFIKVSIQIDGNDSKKAWIKTIYITYNVK